MHHLLSAGFYCLFKNKWFWLSMAAIAVANGYITADVYCWSSTVGAFYPLTTILFAWFIPVTSEVAILCPWFIGTTQKDGLLRNALAAGCSRTQMYLAN